MMFDNFLGGLAWSLGTIIGGGILILIIGFVIGRIDIIPIIGGWLRDILNAAFLPTQRFPTR